MDNCFSCYFGDYEIIIPKNNIEFNNGYGIVNAVFNGEDENHVYNEPLVGIVDSNYKLVFGLMPCFIAHKIKIFANGIILIKYNEELSMVNKNYNVYSCTVNDEGYLQTDISLDAEDFDVVDENVVILKFLISNNMVMVLYNVLERTILTPYYTYIGDFIYNKSFGEEVAEAILTIWDDNFNVLLTLKCYINKLGNVVSPYINTITNTIYDGYLDIEFKSNNGYNK